MKGNEHNQHERRAHGTSQTSAARGHEACATGDTRVASTRKRSAPAVTAIDERFSEPSDQRRHVVKHGKRQVIRGTCSVAGRDSPL